MQNACILYYINLQSLTHKISTVHHTIKESREVLEFLYLLLTVQMGKGCHSDSYLPLIMTIRIPYINLLENLIISAGKSQFTSCYPQPNSLSLVSFYTMKDA